MSTIQKLRPSDQQDDTKVIQAVLRSPVPAGETACDDSGDHLTQQLIDGNCYMLRECEQHFERHPEVKRCLFIKVGTVDKQLPAVVFEPAKKLKDKTAFALEMMKWARLNKETRPISIFYYRSSFPQKGKHERQELRDIIEKWVEPQNYLACPVC